MRKTLVLLMICLCSLFLFFGCKDTSDSSSFVSDSVESTESVEISESEESSPETPVMHTVIFRQEGQPDVIRYVEDGKPILSGEIPVPKDVTGYTVSWVNVDLSNITSDLVVTAVRKAKKFTISFDAPNADKNVSAITVTYNQPYELPQPTYTGYTFDGWKYKGEILASSGVWKIDDKDISLSAVETPKTYSVGLSAEGGQLENTSIDITFGEEYALPTPTYVGYQFVEWTYNGKGIALEGVWSIDDDEIVLEASALPNSSTVYLHSEKGALDMAMHTLVFGDPYQLPIPTYVGYTFKHWLHIGEQVDTSGIWNIAEDNVHLYSVETPNEYTVVLDAGDGTVDKTEMKVFFDDEVDLPVPVLDGYSFICWRYNGQAIGEKWTIPDNVTLFAEWQKEAPTTYTITFVQKDCKNIELTLKIGETLSQDKVPAPKEKTGYTVYWDRLDFSNVSESILVTAIETPKTYKVLLDTTGRIDNVWLTVTYGKPYTLPIPEYRGYTFDGWEYDNKLVSITGVWDIDFDGEYAIFQSKTTAQTYTLTLQTENGHLENDTYKITYGQSYDLPIPTYVGYNFGGWRTENGLIDISGIWTFVLDSFTLYAVENVKISKVCLQTEKGQLEESTFTIAYGQPYSLPAPSYTGYNFDGWYKDGELFETSGVWTVEDATVTLTDKAKPKTYTLVFYSEESLEISSMEIVFGEAFTLPIPKMEDRQFNIWKYGDMYVPVKADTWLIDTDDENNEIILVAVWTLKDGDTWTSFY